jgi:hypothetical protein
MKKAFFLFCLSSSLSLYCDADNSTHDQKTQKEHRLHLIEENSERVMDSGWMLHEGEVAQLDLPTDESYGSLEAGREITEEANFSVRCGIKR